MGYLKNRYIRKSAIIVYLINVAAVLTSCRVVGGALASGNSVGVGTHDAYSYLSTEAEDVSDSYCVVDFGDTISITGNGVWVNQGAVTITKGGEYSLSGILNDGMIYIDTDQIVKLVLNGVSITGRQGPALYCTKAKSLYIESPEGTVNSFSSEVDDEEKAAIYSLSDIHFTGSGSLFVESKSGIGISTPASIYYSNTEMTMNAPTFGFRSDGIIHVYSGTLKIDSDESFSAPEMRFTGGLINGIDYSDCSNIYTETTLRKIA